MKAKHYSWNATAAGYLFIAPLLAVMVVFFAYGFYFLVRTGFQSTDISFHTPKYIGWDNYRLLLVDSRFFHSILNTIVFAVVSVIIGLTFGFVASIFLQFKLPGKKLFHSILFLPTIMPMALIATVIAMMLESRFGTLNTFLRFIGLDFLALQWLSDPNLAYGSIMVMSIFLIGLPIMYYVSEFPTLNTSVLEAAVLDGAGLGRMLTLILFPMLRNTHKTVILSILLGSFREFERIFLLTGGGPMNSTEIVSTYVFRQQNGGMEMGIMSAASVIVLLVAFILALLQIRFTTMKK
ncbi:carbohydrate ABC transporter permease [Cohnella silvisoli]|uniref:Sugar ABC transporter permease n=1 Tax=Cohnella silvisoli TaxID=2873699 RepID=A0ABV1L050_9BACL|nr:sugar ABC transporter permease [Cohnella silvisoli]MCD9024909.1 sugar ABC transporter permease [Cohnella silvisoli]